MATYQPVDLDGWEFKILRSATGAFGKPAKLREALEQEAPAGWSLVEKFDDGRIRLRRSVSARSGDAALGFDPYRTQFGVSNLKLVVLVLGVLLAGTFLLMLAISLVFSASPR